MSSAGRTKEKERCKKMDYSQMPRVFSVFMFAVSLFHARKEEYSPAKYYVLVAILFEMWAR